MVYYMPCEMYIQFPNIKKKNRVVDKVKCRDQKVVEINISLHNFKQILFSNVIIIHYTFLIKMFSRNWEKCRGTSHGCQYYKISASFIYSTSLEKDYLVYLHYIWLAVKHVKDSIWVSKLYSNLLLGLCGQIFFYQCGYDILFKLTLIVFLYNFNKRYIEQW